MSAVPITALVPTCIPAIQASRDKDLCQRHEAVNFCLVPSQYDQMTPVSKRPGQ